VLLVDDWDDDRVVSALSAGVTEVLPRGLVDAPARLVERVVAAVERDRALTNVEELYDGIAGAAGIHDPASGAVLDANRRLADLLGYDRERLGRTPIEDLTADVSGHDAERLRSVVSAVADGDGPTSVEWPFETADGAVRWVEARFRRARIGGRTVVVSTSFDVTESERRFRLIAEHIDEVVYLATGDFSEILYINPAYEEIYGRSVASLSDDPTSFVEAAHPDDRAAYRADVERLIADVEAGDPADAYEGEYRIVRDGETRWVSVSRFPVANADGEVDRIVGRVEDVTEARRREREYEQIFNMAGDGIVVHDPETGDVVDANRQVADLLGYDRETFQNRPLSAFQATDEGVSGADARARIRESARTGGQEFEWPLETADGETVWVRARHEIGEIGGERRIVALLHDITERKRREREYEQIFDGVNDAISVHDPETGEYLDVNDTLCELTGYSREAILEMGIDGISATEDGYTAERAKAFVERVVETGEPDTVEWKIETADGEYRWLEVNGSVATIGGEERFLSLDRDITEAKRREREYEEIFHGVNDAIAVFDPETVEFVDVNDSYRELLGYDLERIRELGIDGLSVTEEGYTAERGRRLIREVARTGDPETVEWKAERRTGEHVWLEVTLATATVGGERRVLSIQRDVTERKRREREYEEIFDGVNDAIAVHDPETGEMVDVNETMCELTGYDRERLLERGAEGLLVDHPDADYPPEAVPELVDRVADGETVRPYEQPVETADGDRVWLEVNPTRATIGGEERFLAISRDITERVRREREYEQIFDGVNDGITVHDPETGEILDANESYLDIFGYDDVETIRTLGIGGLSATEEGYTEERARTVVSEVAASGDPETVEWRIETKAGARRWVEATVAPAEIGGEERVISLHRDVTERKRREREYEQIFNGVQGGITINDPETGELLDVNDSMCDLLGYDRETVRELGVAGISATDRGFTAERSRAFVREVAETGEPVQFEWALETADGETRWLDVQGTLAEIGGERRYLSLTRDVTDRRRTERRLGEILDRIDEAVFMTRAREITAPSGEPEYVSSGYADIWGLSLEEIRENHDDGFFDTLHPDDRAEYRALVERIAADIEADAAADSYSHEYRIERPDGAVRWVQSDYYPTAWDGGDPRIVIVSRDVTDRKSRERRIASFDEATDGLATADTRGEAARTAVEAATDALELPAVGAFLYDDEAGVLRPEVVAGTLPSAVDGPVGSGDGPLWEAFATGGVASPDGGTVGDRGGSDVSTTLGDLAEWRALALGGHGVLLVASPDGTLGSETIQSAHVLAATLEAALNHLEGRRRLEAREEQLRTQTERAERLDRIAGLAQRVEAAITDASSPGEVERAVCARLADSGPYDLAWIGGVDVGSDQLAARALVGGPDGYVESLGLSVSGEVADPHPAVGAWRTDEVRVVDSVVGDGPTGDWRRWALSEGIQSLCAVPLTYSGVTHGVLAVGTDAPDTFDEREREVLAQLGTSIANALAAIERRRALESDETVELEFRGAGDRLPFARAANAADCSVELERTVARQDGSVSVYFAFEGDVPENAPDVARRTLRGTVDVVAADESSLLVETRTDDWFGTPIAEYGGVLREASAEPGGTSILVEVPRQTDVRSFVERLRDVAPSLELVARRQHRRRDRTPAELSDRITEELTDRQVEVVRTALSAGYFEWPRDNDGGEVADRLGITQPTFNKHLRIAERETFGLLFGDE
jgi:PAS domain S-box-containing protein